jgi:hypothetical protein
VIESFPNQDGEVRWGVAPNLCLDDQIARLRVEIVDNSIGVAFEEGMDLVAESVVIVASSLEFANDSD